MTKPTHEDCKFSHYERHSGAPVAIMIFGGGRPWKAGFVRKELESRLKKLRDGGYACEQTAHALECMPKE